MHPLYCNAYYNKCVLDFLHHPNASNASTCTILGAIFQTSKWRDSWIAGNACAEHFPRLSSGSCGIGAQQGRVTSDIGIDGQRSAPLLEDFLLGTTEVMFRDMDELAEVVNLYMGKELKVYVITWGTLITVAMKYFGNPPEVETSMDPKHRIYCQGHRCVKPRCTTWIRRASEKSSWSPG